MNQVAFPMRLLVHFRIVRPMIDLLILVAAAGGFAYLQTRAHGHENTRLQQAKEDKPRQKPIARNRKQEPVQEAKPLFLASTHDAEEHMWKAWENWLKTEKPVAGNCLMEKRDETGAAQFHLHCFGNANEKFVAVLPPGEVLFPKGIFSLTQPSTSRTKKKIGSEQTAPPESAESAEIHVPPAYTSSGWIDTSKGRRHFDPITGKWLP